MSETNEVGRPYPSEEAGLVDEWSERIYAALRDWSLLQGGIWTRWQPGYVLLTIDCVDDESIDPIQLYTADEELTITFGYWETHNPAPYELWNAEPEIIAEHAKALVHRWLSGEVRTAILTDGSGKWCGSVMIEPGELTPQLQAAAQWVRDFQPVSIEVRTPFKREWRAFAVEPEWLQSPPP